MGCPGQDISPGADYTTDVFLLHGTPFAFLVPIERLAGCLFQHEISRLKECSEPREGGLPAVEMYDLIQASPDLKNLHSEAWDYADSVVQQLRNQS